MNTELISKNLALEAIESIRSCIWDVDIPSPTVPEYVEHHEQMQMLMSKCDSWKKILEREPSKTGEWVRVYSRPGVFKVHAGGTTPQGLLYRTHGRD